MTTINVGDTITLLMAALALLFSFITVLFSILAYCKVIGLQSSTHKIQYMSDKDFKEEWHKESEEKEEEINEKTGMPITDPVKKEELRQKKLLEGFADMYKDHEE